MQKNYNGTLEDSAKHNLIRLAFLEIIYNRLQCPVCKYQTHLVILPRGMRMVVCLSHTCDWQGEPYKGENNE